MCPRGTATAELDEVIRVTGAAANAVTVVFDESARDAEGLTTRLDEAGYPVVA